MAKTVAEMIDPRDQGAGPLDLRKPVFDPNAVARANEALKAMAGEFQAWLDRDISRIQDARLKAEASAWSDTALEALMIASHDLKGLGGSYEYPIVTQISASLCRLIETEAGKAAARAEPALVTAHVDALRAAARGQIRTDAHPVGRELLMTLETRVAALGVAPR